MEAQIAASIGLCSEFMKSIDSEKAELTVVISPLKITENAEGKVNITSGCNFWRSCHNVNCYYSVEARDESKKRLR